jgi:hypothetical protein
MTETPFELELEQRLLRRTTVMDQPFDAREVARAAVLRRRRRRALADVLDVIRLDRRWSSALFVALLAMLIAAALITLIVGADRPKPPRLPADHAVFRWIYPPGGMFGGHSVTRLLDGRVLAVGSPDGSAFIWDPTTEQWTGAGELPTIGTFVTTTLLLDGSVLVTSQDPSAGQLATAAALVWDPVTETTRGVGRPITPLLGGSRLTLDDGRVLFGRGDLAQVYDPRTESFHEAGSLGDRPYLVDQLPLADGRVLYTWGIPMLLDPTTASMQPASGLDPDVGRPNGTCDVLVLADGRVLVLDGDKGAGIWDPDVGTMAATDPLPVSLNGNCAATLLDDGRVLIVSGWGETMLFELR